MKKPVLILRKRNYLHVFILPVTPKAITVTVVSSVSSSKHLYLKREVNIFETNLHTRVYYWSNRKNEREIEGGKEKERKQGWVKVRGEERTIHLKGRDDSHSCKARRPRIARKNNRCTLYERRVGVRITFVRSRNVSGKQEYLQVKTIRHTTTILILSKVICYFCILFELSVSTLFA